MASPSAYKRQRQLLNIFIMLASVVVLGAIGVYLPRSLAPDDGDALVGGQIESGYPATGYLVASTATGQAQQCTAVFVGVGMALTAAHCVRPDDSVVIGSGEFTLDRTLEVLKYAFFPRWQQAQVSENDLIKLEIPYLLTGSSVAEVGAPAFGCDYTIVAYGRNEEGIRGLRKSADFCINQISAETFRLTSSEGAVCFGDSGSPIFRKGTNQVVGVTSQIANSDDETCDFDDEVIATRLDAKRDFIAAAITDSNSDFVPGGSTGNAANPLGNFVGQLASSPVQLILLGLGLLVLISFIFLVRTLFSKPEAENTGEIV